jgi:hypothetical protein
MEDKNEEPIFEFRGEEIEFVKLTAQQEREINEYLGVKGAICLDNKTKIIDNDKIEVDYGKVVDIEGNIVDAPPVDEELLKKLDVNVKEQKVFIRNSIFH